MAVSEQAILSTANNVGATVGDMFLWILVLIIIIGLAVFFINFLSYTKRKVILYEKLSNGTRFKIVMAKEIKTKEGIPKWKLWGVKKRFDAPPNESLYSDNKGKLIAQAFYINENIVWVKAQFNNTTEDLNKINFEPFLSEDKSVAVHEFRESEQYKKKTLGEFILNALPMITIVIIIAMFFIFFGQVVEPSIAMGNQLVASQIQMDKTIEKLDVLINNRPVTVVQPSQTIITAGAPN